MGRSAGAPVLVWSTQATSILDFFLKGTRGGPGDGAVCCNEIAGGVLVRLTSQTGDGGWAINTSQSVPYRSR